MTTKEMPAIDSLFSRHPGCDVNQAEANALLDDIVEGVRVHAVGHGMPQHVILWARRSPTGHAFSSVTPIVLSLTEKALGPAVRSIMEDEHGRELVESRPDQAAWAAAMRQMPGFANVSDDELKRIRLLEFVYTFVVKETITKACEAFHACAATLIGPRGLLKEDGGQKVASNGIVFSHEHVLTGARSVWLPYDLAEDGKIVSFGTAEDLPSNANPDTQALTDLLPPSCYGAFGAARGVS